MSCWATRTFLAVRGGMAFEGGGEEGVRHRTGDREVFWHPSVQDRESRLEHTTRL
jgi:hypothetical protein